MCLPNICQFIRYWVLAIDKCITIKCQSSFYYSYPEYQLFVLPPNILPDYYKTNILLLYNLYSIN